MIKVIIFDADGPLYQRSDSVTQSKIELLHKYGYDGDYCAFDDAYNKEKFKAYDQTENASEMFANVMLQIDAPLGKNKAREFTEEFNTIQSQIEASPFAVETLRILHAQDYKVCILTDSFYPGDEKWNWFEKLGMADYVNYIISSYDIGHLKDSKEAYEACLAEFKVPAREAIFVGHQQYEMDGAKLAGVISIALKPILIPENTKGDYELAVLSELPNFLKSLETYLASLSITTSNDLQ